MGEAQKPNPEVHKSRYWRWEKKCLKETFIEELRENDFRNQGKKSNIQNICT